MTFTITLTPDEDGTVVAECLSIPGCISQGRTEAEAEANITLAIRECLAVRSELGLPLTVVTKQIEIPA
jgi:predicted RNase H-like HicB family nuclease